MKKFAAQYPVEGSAALQPRIEGYGERCASIVPFPGAVSSKTRPAHAKVSADPVRVRLVREARASLNRCDTVRELRYGTIAGRPFGQMKRWETGLAMAAFTFTFLAVTFMGV